MKNGIIIDGEVYEYVKCVTDERDKDQISNVCKMCALREKCHEHEGCLCDVYDKGMFYCFKRVNEQSK